MIRLLELHPLSQRPQPGAFGQQPPEAQDDSSEQQGTAVSTCSQAQGLHQSTTWPTPDPNVWRDIELVAGRACAALDWALSLTVGLYAPSANVELVAEQLSHLLELLVIGHLQDLDLDMRTLFKATLKPILSALLGRHEEYTGLAVAMLSRLALDDKMMSQNMLEIAPLIISLSCEHRMLISRDLL